MQEYIVLLSKKHGQLKQAITRMTQEAMQCLEQTPDMKTKLELIDTLRTVTDGKVLQDIVCTWYDLLGPLLKTAYFFSCFIGLSRG